MTFVLRCPECKYPQYCGCCDNCKKIIPEGIKPHIPTKDGESIICAGCGFTEGIDLWLGEAVKQMKQAGLWE